MPSASPDRKKYVSGRLANDAFDGFQWNRFIVWVSMKRFSMNHTGIHRRASTREHSLEPPAAHSVCWAWCISGRKKMMNHDYQVQIIVQRNSSELNILIAISGVITLNLFLSELFAVISSGTWTRPRWGGYDEATMRLRWSYDERPKVMQPTLHLCGKSAYSLNEFYSMKCCESVRLLNLFVWPPRKCSLNTVQVRFLRELLWLSTRERQSAEDFEEFKGPFAVGRKGFKNIPTHGVLLFLSSPRSSIKYKFLLVLFNKHLRSVRVPVFTGFQ